MLEDTYVVTKTNKVVPLGLAIQVEPTIGNHNEEFLNKWYEKLNSFSFELMKDVEFCKSTTTDLSTQIKEVDASIKTKIQPAKYTELSKALQENQEIRKRQLQQRKIKKFNHLKYKKITTYHCEKDVNLRDPTKPMAIRTKSMIEASQGTEMRNLRMLPF